MIDINEEIFEKFVNALVYKDDEAEEYFQRSINNKSGRGTQNGKHQVRWSRKYNSIMEIAEGNGLNAYKINRVIWEAVIVQDENGSIYLFFRDRNIKNIMKKGKETHYAKLIIRAVNEAFDELSPLHSQGTFSFSEEEAEPMYPDEYLMELAQKIKSIFKKEPEKAVIITFDSKHSHDIAHAYIYNTRYEVVWDKDLTHLIDTDYNPVLERDDVKPEKQESSRKAIPKRIVKLKQ